MSTVIDHVNLRTLVGSGDKIAIFVVPFLVVGLALNIAFPGVFDIGGPSPVLQAVSIAILVIGVAIWLSSVYLVLTRVPRGELITTGPYALVRHPLYTSVALLVLPWLGFLLNTWLGVVLGIAMYVGSRRHAPEEEATLEARFGAQWDDYARSVKLPWL
jgi:protein-S-isoprenylcysteine O-methyltransferase Ste14